MRVILMGRSPNSNPWDAWVRTLAAHGRLATCVGRAFESTTEKHVGLPPAREKYAVLCNAIFSIALHQNNHYVGAVWKYEGTARAPQAHVPNKT